MAGRMCREMSGCGDEERLASERGGRVIIFSQEFPHLKSSLGSPLLYVCSPLLHYIAAASGPWLHGAIPSASVCVCVCTPDYPELINYNSFSSIQFLSLTTQNMHSSLLPSFFLLLMFHFGICSSSSSQQNQKTQQNPPQKQPAL